MISELNTLLSTGEKKLEEIVPKLSPASKECLESLPPSIQSQLLLDRDPHGNIQVSRIETERLFIDTVKQELEKRQKGIKFGSQPLFCGYEGRSCQPSNFDANYCYALGHVAAMLIDGGATGYMATLSYLAGPVESWVAGGSPLVAMMNLEQRKGALKPVIRKALVDLKGPFFANFVRQQAQWKLKDDYRYPGPIQFTGPADLVDTVTFTLRGAS